MHPDKTLAPNETSIMNFMTGPGLNAEKRNVLLCPRDVPVSAGQEMRFCFLLDYCRNC